MKIYRAYYESRKFTFEAYSQDESIAKFNVLVGLRKHTKQYKCEPDWFMIGDSDGIEVDEYELNTCYRDRSKV